MLEHKLFGRKSIISTWLISYILILILPIIISGVMYARVENIVKNEVNRCNSLFLNEIKQNIDGITMDVQKLSTEIAFNVNVRSVLKLNKNFNNEQWYSIYETVKDLKTLSLNLKNTNKFYIYLKQSDLIMDEISSYDPKSFYTIYEFSKYMTFEDWYSIITKNANGTYVTIPSKEENESDAKIYYLRSIPIEYKGEMLGNIVIDLNNSRFIELKQELEDLNKGYFFILDNENKLIGGINNKITNLINYNDLKGEMGQSYIKHNNKEMLVSHINSNNNKWKYVYVMPKDIFLSKVQYARKIFILSIIICLTLGIATSCILLKRNYAPLKKLVGSIVGDIDKEGNFNEYALIETAIDKMAQERKKVNDRLSAQNIVLKSRFIERLLKGKEGLSTINDSLSFFNIRFISDNFCVVSFFIEDFYEYFYKESNENYNEAFKLVQFVITNALEDILGNKGQVLVAEVDDMIVAILNLNDSYVEGGMEKVRDSCTELKKFINDNFKISFNMAISNIHKSVEEIPIAYKQSMEVMEYKLVMGIDENLFFSEIREGFKGEYYYPLDREQQLINCIKIGDSEKAMVIVNEVFSKNFEERTLSGEMTKCLIFNFISTIIKAANDMGEIIDKGKIFNINSIESLINHKSINKVKVDLNNIIVNLCNSVSVKHKGSSGEVEDNVKKYIQDNYKDENLSISAIADFFGMHPSYISKVFKSQAGEGMLDYLNKVRVNKAKELMKEHKSNLEDLAKAVGYSSVRTFTRAFSKYEGITPGKYKDML